jgi:ATP-dependent RNA helicase DDX56/DBP9
VDKDKEASKRVKDRESGVARGIDFQFVANVINFDFPKVSPPFYNFITTYGPRIDAALYLMLLMRANPLLGQVGEGWALEI